MSAPKLYRGVWPQNVSKLAKYVVRRQDGMWKVTVQYEVEDGLKYLAVEQGDSDVVPRVNDLKTRLQGSPGGAFYVNEYRHVIVPISSSSNSGNSSNYFYAGQLQDDFIFEFEGSQLTTKPINLEGTPLKSGEIWKGPRPGIPYILSAGGNDIYYEKPALTDDDPPSVRPGMTMQMRLSKRMQDRSLLKQAIDPIRRIRGYEGGRFYVNEHCAIFTPVDDVNRAGIEYVYCGQLDMNAWFPEPVIEV